jgi:multidrug efflux pump subunit AcrB
VWIVRVALNRPYTFIVLCLLILLISPLVIQRTPTDIFPNVNIPVVAVLWNYTGLSAEEMEERIASGFERSLTTTVSDMEHIESQTVNGRSIVKIFFHPSVRIEMAVAQVTALAQSALRQMPVGTTPPYILVYSASSVPILQISLSGKGLSEQQLFDYAANFIRTRLATVQGAAIPWPYGGKQRQVMVDIRPDLLQAKGLSPADVVSAINTQNLVLPSGTSKIGEFEYDVDLNSSPSRIQELNDLPIKAVNNTTIYIHDVAHVRDGYSPQTNIVRRDGMRGSLLTVMKVGSASTLDIVQEVKAALPGIAAQLPPELKMEPIADQSIFVRAAVSGVVREAIIAACLTAAMILLFLGSWRSTLIIAVSIPLSILVSICCMSALGETINIMTLGGPGAGGRNSGRRRHCGNRKHPSQHVAHRQYEGCDSRRRAANCRARDGLHLMHLHRVPPDVLPHRCGALPVHPAGRGRGFCDARVLPALANPGSDARPVSSEASRRRASQRTRLLEHRRPIPARLRARPGAGPQQFPRYARRLHPSSGSVYPGVSGGLRG